MIFDVYGEHRPALASEERAGAGVVEFEPTIDVLGMANVERAVGAPQDVDHHRPDDDEGFGTDVPGSEIMSAVLPFDSLAVTGAHSLAQGIRLTRPAMSEPGGSPEAKRQVSRMEAAGVELLGS